jgi:hypothetical protein
MCIHIQMDIYKCVWTYTRVCYTYVYVHNHGNMNIVHILIEHHGVRNWLNKHCGLVLLIDTEPCTYYDKTRGQREIIFFVAVQNQVEKTKRQLQSMPQKRINACLWTGGNEVPHDSTCTIAVHTIGLCFHYESMSLVSHSCFSYTLKQECSIPDVHMSFFSVHKVPHDERRLRVHQLTKPCPDYL